MNGSYISTRGLLPLSVDSLLNMFGAIDNVVWCVVTAICEIDMCVVFGTNRFALLA